MDEKKKRVLVVEDNVAFQAVLLFNLENAGLDVVGAGNGVEAWQQLQDSHFDLVISDQQMPGMSGIEIVQRMRESERDRSTPVILVTAKGFELDTAYLKEDLGIREVFHKPFSPSSLMAAVASILEADSRCCS